MKKTERYIKKNKKEKLIIAIKNKEVTYELSKNVLKAAKFSALALANASNLVSLLLEKQGG